MRSGRLVALLLRLQASDGATAPQLAAALEVSTRTIYRDVAALQAAGVPLWTEPGRYGGIRLLAGWRTRLDGLTGDEAAALFLAGAPGAADQLGLSAVLVAAQEKVLATLPGELRAHADRVRACFHLDAPGWFHRDEPVPHLAAVASAAWSQRPLRMRYRGWDRDRRIAPLGLVLKAGTWYLVAADAAGHTTVGTGGNGGGDGGGGAHARAGDAGGGDARRRPSAPRTYRVARIVGAAPDAGEVVRPPGFDLAAWWADSSAAFAAQLDRFTCRLRLSPWAQRRLRDVVAVEQSRRALAGAGPPDADGWREVEVATESLEVAADQFTAFGAGVEVVAPVALRRRLARIGADMAARNA